MPRDGEVTELNAANAERIVLATNIPLSPYDEELEIRKGIINAGSGGNALEWRPPRSGPSLLA